MTDWKSLPFVKNCPNSKTTVFVTYLHPKINKCQKSLFIRIVKKWILVGTGRKNLDFAWYATWLLYKSRKPKSDYYVGRDAKTVIHKAFQGPPERNRSFLEKWKKSILAVTGRQKQHFAKYFAWNIHAFTTQKYQYYQRNIEKTIISRTRPGTVPDSPGAPPRFPGAPLGDPWSTLGVRTLQRLH